MQYSDKCQCRYSGKCQCTENISKNHEIHVYFNDMFHDEKLADKYCDCVVTKSGFETLDEFDSVGIETLLCMKDDIPLSHIHKISKSLTDRNEARNGILSDSTVYILKMIAKFIFLLSSAIYVGFCFMLIGLNELIIANNEGQVRVFHVIEFAAPFCYSLVVTLVVWHWPEKSADNEKWFIFGKTINVDYIVGYVKIVALLLECMTGATSLLLVLVAQEDFEYIAHFLEYSAFLLLALVNLALLLTSKDSLWKRLLSLLLTLISICAAISMIGMQYHGLDFESHYVEFPIEIVLTIATMISVSIAKQ